MNVHNQILNKFGGVLILLSLLVTGCQDVVEIETPSEPPRLVVDALIRVDTLEATTRVVVKVSETNSFFESVPPADLQQISLDNLDFPLGGGTDNSILIEEEPGSGIYSKVFPTSYLTRGRLFLQIDFEDEFYVALGEFVPTSPFDEVIQGPGDLTGDNETELIVTFTDDPKRDDWYLFDFDLREYLVSQDQFFQGQQFSFSYFYDEELEPGTELEISIMGVDERFHDYMDKVIEQSSQDFGVFETPALTVRGNIINATDIDNDDVFDNVDNADNFALGYFAVVQEYKTTIIVE
jgi:hypothetical protein